MQISLFSCLNIVGSFALIYNSTYNRARLLQDLRDRLVNVLERLLQHFPNMFRLIYYKPSNAVPHGGILLHLIATTDRVLRVDNKLLALVDALVVSWPNIAF